jgi:DNA primase
MKKHILIANEYVIELEGPKIFLDGIRHHLLNQQTFKQYAKEQVGFHKSEIKRMDEMRNELLNEKPYYLSEAEEWCINENKQEHREHINKLEKIVNNFGKKFEKKDFDIQNYKQVPIGDLLELNNYDFACCVWHNEKTPSMKYYDKTNTVYCFSCNKSGDVIDVVQQINKVDFKGAIDILKKYA